MFNIVHPVFLNVMQNVTGINNGAFTKNRPATSKEDCLCSNEGKTTFVASKKIAKRAKLAKFLKYVTLGIKPDINFDCLWDDFWIFVSY
jgi:hypothetical protein